MRICYILLSPTFGMHQYTADLVNRAVARPDATVHLVTTTNYPTDRYAPAVQVHTPLTTHNTGLSVNSLDIRRLEPVWRSIIAMQPDVVHFTGPHLWNVQLLYRLRQQGVPTIHTLHDLDPHKGARGGGLLHLWNNLVLRLADRILVHGNTYQTRLCRHTRLKNKVVYTPLLHLFVSHEQQATLSAFDRAANDIQYEPFILFFGRLEKYKGVNDLLTAFAQLRGAFAPQNGADGMVTCAQPPRLVLAGPGQLSDLWAGALPAGVEVRNRLIGDAEAIDLFRRCSLVVLPYIDGTQSALIPAAYYFYKPVVVTRVGALAEYVEEGQTGLVVEAGHPASLTRALYIALTEPDLLRQMGQAGRDWYDSCRIQETKTLFQLYQQARQAPLAHGDLQTSGS